MINKVINNKKLAGFAMLGLLSVAGCGDQFLRGGELTTDPNRPVTATKNRLFQGVQTNIWSVLGSNPARTTGILAQQFFGAQSQYDALQTAYNVDPNSIAGNQSGLYGGGGLVDIVSLEKQSIASGDSLFLGIARVQEGLLMGTGADLYGDLVYSQALTDIPNPKLDDQLAVFDSVQKVLSAAIANLAAKPSTNVGPGGDDRVYGGDPAKWAALAHTLKARFYMHTGEVRPTAYAQALAEAQQGIMSDAGNYVGTFTGSTNEQNFYFQFNYVAGRQGYLLPNRFLDTLLRSRNDPRRTQYFAINAKTDSATQISAARLDAAYQQPYVTYDENTLRWAESAYRTGDFVTALAKLNVERTHNGLPAEAVVGGDPKMVTGGSLLNEILIEEYISDFQLGNEAFNLYKRTCTPNLVPTVAGAKIPRRFFYDASEQQTNTNIPGPGTGVNGFANKNDPANATSDGTGAVCLGQ